MSTYKSLLGQKLAVLVANGFCEKNLTEIQRALVGTGVNIRVISMDHGLVNSWDGAGWGLHFAADNVLSDVLAADYDMLIIPSGQRSINKLKLTPHTPRFINGFLNTGKPVAVFDGALELLLMTANVAGRTLTGPESFREDVENAGATWSDKAHAVDGPVISGGADPEERAAYVAAVTRFLVSGGEHAKAASLEVVQAA